MTTRRRYSKADKIAAVVAAEMTTPLAAAEKLGVPESTVRYWVDSPKFAELRQKTREESAAGFTVLMHMAQARLAELVPTMEPRDLTILLGVSAEKAQLMSGDVTSRTETLNVTDGLDADTKRNLRRVFDRVAAAERARLGEDEGTGAAIREPGPGAVLR